MVCRAQGDNRGPQNVTDVLEDWAAMQKLFPGATVKAATVNDYADALEAVSRQPWRHPRRVPLRGSHGAPVHASQSSQARDSLPVVRDEIGDTWIYGSASDPKKTAMFREVRHPEAQGAHPYHPSRQSRSIVVVTVRASSWGCNCADRARPTRVCRQRPLRCDRPRLSAL